MSVKVNASYALLDALTTVLRRAESDWQHYQRHGNPQADHGAEWPAVKKRTDGDFAKVARFIDILRARLEGLETRNGNNNGNDNRNGNA